ncbi:MAG: coproporphyrinogen III oxidase family protein [Treponema sp.]|jgi:oxygen-independent coproporphyrinogen-3 oxidase|nr:coproporphyrinogen III oxidase family protein [Treponema sp.]
MEASLYLHIPFCAGACDYCDFYSVPVRPDGFRPDAFTDALLAGVRECLAHFAVNRVPTLYVGGGTPSILGAARIRRLLTGLRSLLPAWPEEVTIEANPESADGAFLSACREGGVNRISLGVQTFHETSRRLVHRVGEGGLLPERLSLVSGLFPGAFSADLISGLPGQDEKVLAKDIETLLAFGPAHVSLYALTAVPKLPGSPPDDEADRLWLLGRDLLEQAGYTQYEVSNFSRPGKRSRHNIRYWRMENWLGAGPSASGTVINDNTGTGRRYTVKADVDAYLALPRPKREGRITVEALDRLTLIKETFLMGFRYTEGPDRELFAARFGATPEAFIPRTLERWRERGLLHGEKTALNRDGLLLLNPFLLDIFEELELNASGGVLPRTSPRGGRDASKHNLAEKVDASKLKT